MFPEPDDTGSGSPAGIETEAAPEKVADNPFDSSFSESDTEVAETATDEAKTEEAEEFALTFEDGLDLDDSEKGFFAEAAKECGLSADVASKVFSNLVRKVNENNERMAKEQAGKDLDALRKAWGKNFTANSKQAAQLIKTVAARCGWSAERVEGLKNPADMQLFYDIAVACGGRLTLGLNNGAPAKLPKTKEQLANELHSTVVDFWAAKDRGDMAEAKRLSDLHMELFEAQTGKKGQRMLSGI